MDEATQKGLATRQRRWEARNEKRRLKALEEEAKAAKIKAEDEKYMKEAIKQAKKAAKIGDVPIGCVLVKDGQIIARGYNRRNADKTVLSLSLCQIHRMIGVSVKLLVTLPVVRAGSNTDADGHLHLTLTL